MIARLWSDFLTNSNTIVLLIVFSAAAFMGTGSLFVVLVDSVYFITTGYIPSRKFTVIVGSIGGFSGFLMLLAGAWAFGQAWKGG